MKITKITLLLLVCYLLTACQTYDAYTGQAKTNNASIYGGIGAATCALIGSRKNSETALKYSAVCGLAGAGAGSYMDAQENQLRAQLLRSGVQVSREGNNIRLIMPNNITFGVNQTTLTPAIYDTLNSIVLVLDKYRDTILHIGGHTDSDGSHRHNQQLSERRAQSVYDYLVSRQVTYSRLRVIGYGETMPIIHNNTHYAKTQNRRVELLITYATQQPQSRSSKSSNNSFMQFVDTSFRITEALIGPIR